MMRPRRRARAAYGSGTIEKRGDAWWLRHSDGVGADRRRWREGPFRSQEEAIVHRDRGTRLRGTAATPIDQWLTEWARRTAVELYSLERESDADIKKRHVRLHLAPRLAGIRVGDIRVADINQLYRNLIDSGLKPKTVANIRGTLSCALGDAVADGLLSFNPVRDSKLPRKHRGTVKSGVAPMALQKVLEPDEFQRFTEWCAMFEASNRWAVPLLLIANTGMRRGEALGLRWDKIDLATRKLTIDQQVEQLDSGELVVRPVKTEESNRTIELTPGTVELLRRHRSRHPDDHPARLIFYDRRKNPLVPDSMTQYVHKHLIPKLNLPSHFSPHALRHTHASMLLDDGVADAVVALRLGHSSPHITQRIYNKGTKAGDAAAARRWTTLTGQ